MYWKNKSKKFDGILTFFYYFETITSLQKFTGRTFLPILFKPFENEFAYLLPIIPEYFSVHFLQTRTFLLQNLNTAIEIKRLTHYYCSHQISVIVPEVLLWEKNLVQVHPLQNV